ncbi:MAG TPA: glycosyltransferase family 4 protein [Clostridiales bacterium]|nr:glycosyltransferase family 4 protein [Clostridiales bacterium]
MFSRFKKPVYVGDLYKNTGPSNVNRAYYKYLCEQMIFTHQQSRLPSVPELIFKVICASAVVVSGIGYKNLLAVKLGALLKKPVFYLMHGCYEYEYHINRLVPNQRTVHLEKLIMEKTTRIICVSERFSQWVGLQYPQYTAKLDFINNGIEWNDLLREENDPGLRNPEQIVTMGGGRPQKNNLMISQAVELLNSAQKQTFQLIVLGRDGEDTDALRQNPHTSVVGQVDRDEAKKYLKGAGLYVQNSTFESFGLGVIEALGQGCSILVSQNVGALSIMPGMEEQDIINDCTDINEIAKKILYLSRHGNNERILNHMDKAATSMKTSADRLYDMITERLI